MKDEIIKMDKNIKFDDFNKAVVNSIREYLPITFANADVNSIAFWYQNYASLSDIFLIKFLIYR